MMNKLSNAQIAEVLTDASATIRAQAEKIAELETQQYARSVHDHAVKIATEMHRKGINMEVPSHVLIDHLEKAAEQNKLHTIEEAVNMVGPDMGTKIAQISNDEARSTLGASDLERFLIGASG